MADGARSDRLARPWRCGAILVALLLGVVAVRPTVAAASVRPAALAPPPLPVNARALGALPGAQPISFEVVLAPSDPGGLRSFLDGLYSPSSTSYHRWLASGEFDELFGPAPGTVATALGWLRGLGLQAEATSDLVIRASGSAGSVAAGLGVTFDRYAAPGQSGYAASGTPEVPSVLADQVQAIVGLDTLPDAVSHLVDAGSPSGPAPHAVAQGLGVCAAAAAVAAQDDAYTASSLGAGYGIGGLLADGVNGSGQHVGVIELATPSIADVTGFQNCYGLTNQITPLQIDAGGPSGGVGTAEADVDIEQLAAQAPGASITSYDAPDSDQGEYDALSRAVNDDAAGIISDSWGLCEPLDPTSGSGSIASLDVLFEQAAAQGQAVFTAAGDSGSEDCYGSDGDQSLAVDYPASSPWVTAVGGTSRSLDGTEVVWNGCDGVDPGSACAADSGAGGGGASSIEPRPTWQSGLVEPASASCGSNGANCREVPDVSADAGVPVAFYVGGAWGVFLGTSVAAPLVAAMWADRESGCSGPASGDAAPTLYQLAASGAYGYGLNDITAGTNDLTGAHPGDYDATVGYDLASGLGSVLGDGIACTTVRSISPIQGPAGTVVTIGGLGLENASVSFGGQSVPVLSATATSLQVVAPAGSGTVTVSATGPVATAPGSGTFTYGAPSGLFQRVYGTTAIDTAIAASQAAFPAAGSADAVVLARSDFFSDALAGGPLAASVHGPLLITEGAGESSSLDPAVETEIERVLAPGGTVDILGGDLALSPSIDTTLQQLGYDTVRIAGTDEYDTAVLIAERLGNPSTIFEATGLNFADALSAVPAAIATHGAILLTQGSTQDPETAAYLAAHPGDARYAVGGPLAAAGADPTAVAVFGQDQYGTSAAVAATFFPHPSVVAAATGTNFPDALAAGPGLGLAGGPLLLVAPSGALPPAIQAYLQAVGSGVRTATLYGGPLAVDDQVLAELDGAL